MQETELINAEADSPDLSVLTKQEQEVFKFLLEGKSSNEISGLMDISGGTVNYHRYNLYKKLGIHSINELYNKYLPAYDGSAGGKIKPRMLSVKTLLPAVLIIIAAAFFAVIAALVWSKSADTAKTSGTDVVFDFWFAMGDEKSHSLVTRQMENINGKEELVVSISGILESNDITYSGVYGRPNPRTLEAMREMKSISFSFLGDGNRYYICFPTIETIVYKNPYIGKDEIYGEHWLKILETEKGVISNINIRIPDDLIWLNEESGKPSFNLKNLNCFQIQPIDPGSYHLKWWDIRIK